MCCWEAGGFRAHQAVVRGVVERQRGASLQAVQRHKVPHVLQDIHALGVAAVHPEPAPQPTTQ